MIMIKIIILIYKSVRMMNSTIFYEIKKEADKRSSPYFAPNSEDDDIRA